MSVTKIVKRAIRWAAPCLVVWGIPALVLYLAVKGANAQ